MATTLRFSGSAIEAIDSGGNTLETAPFPSGVDGVVGLLTATVRVAPDVSEVEQQCAAAHTLYRWGDALSVTAWADSTDFVIGFAEPSVADIRLETTGGFAPGEYVVALVASLPETSVARLAGGDVFMAFDVVSSVTRDEYSSPVGAVGHSADGATLDAVLTPAEWVSFLC